MTMSTGAIEIDPHDQQIVASDDDEQARMTASARWTRDDTSARFDTPREDLWIRPRSRAGSRCDAGRVFVR
jgi:hypothetical protein